MKLTNECVNAKVHKIKKLEMEKKELEEQINELKTNIKDAMRENGVNEFRTDKFIVRNKEITSNRFDTKQFKKDHTDLYEAYTVESVSERFTIN